MVAIALPSSLWAIGGSDYITTSGGKDLFKLSASGKSTTLYISSEDFPGVIRAVNQLKTDLGKVSGNEPQIKTGLPDERYAVIIGTIGKSELIDRLIARKKIDVTDIRGKWESTLIQVVNKPFPEIKKALVIAGSDKRGTIFGIYDLSAKAGVSPWYWWADVPVRKHSDLYVSKGRYLLEAPKVKYRGIFINDEAPALSGWVLEKFGGFNHQFYEHVFELILRLKGNFLWPAMWGRAFYDDDPLNPKLADEYGIVIGTSHHEPMMRAHDEWRRYGSGQWNYEANPEILRKFWSDGIRRKGNYESLVTVGMRGDGDAPMSESSNIALLEKIISDQRTIVTEVTGKPAAETPQVWALYKEVQDYYDKGMRVPDDITLLMCDDNWGNVRKLPKITDVKRKGGYGMYYHFDYVGGPRNYKWLNTNPIARIWEQMNLCYQYGVDRIWIVNVGDIKPMEFPIEFFLDFAWNPNALTVEELQSYSKKWAAKYFGYDHASEIARLIDNYSRFNGRRKPELLDWQIYSLVDYSEAEKVVSDYNSLSAEAERLYNLMPPEYSDAFYQLILYPVKACANLNELYYHVALNRLYASQGRSATIETGGKVRELYETDSLLSYHFNHILADGKWNHMMDQTHIGYTYWQQPPANRMPGITDITLPEQAEMRIAVEGSEKWWPKEKTEAVLPVFDSFNRQKFYFEIFNAGQIPFEYSIVPGSDFLVLSSVKGRIDKQERIYAGVNWDIAPKGRYSVPVIISGTDGKKVTVMAIIYNPDKKDAKDMEGYLESNGYIAAEAAAFSRKVENDRIEWKEIPGLGKTVSGMTTFPVNRRGEIPSKKSSRLEYDLWILNPGEMEVTLYLSPTLDFNGAGLRYAVSFDENEPLVIDFHNRYSTRDWEKWVSDNIILSTSEHIVSSAGKHVLKIWSVDPGVIIQKITVNTGGLKPSYLGPPQSCLLK